MTPLPAELPEHPPGMVLALVGACHIWWRPVVGGAAEERWLSPDEHRSAAAFRSDVARRGYVSARMATRGVLAGYLGVSPPEVIIRRDCERCGGAHGRPRVDGEDVEFSVSHSRTWFGIAVSRGIRIGFDVEPVTSGQLSNRAMTGLFGPEERQAFACLPPGDRSVAIARAWTRKEAVSKLTGLGLAARFRELDVRESHLIVRVGRSSSPPTGVALLDVPGPAGHVATLARTADHRPDPEPGLARNPRAGPAE